VIQPLARTEILIDPYSARHASAGGEIREDDGQMPGFRNHRIVTITAALTIPTRMNMHIGHNRHFQLAALLPYKPEPSAVELDNAVLEACRINIVVIEELPYPPNPALCASEKKGAAFAHPPSAPHQLIDAITPDMLIAEQPRRLAECRAQ
jgi:hypothetical protein